MTKFFLLIALCIVAAICAEVVSETQFKKLKSIHENFTKNVQAAAAANQASNLRTMGANAGSYAVVQYFNNGNCGGTPLIAYANGLNTCYPLLGGGSIQGTTSGGNVVVTTYTDNACQTANTGVPTDTVPLNTCTGASINGVSLSFNLISQTSATPTYSSNGITLNYFDTTADCNANGGSGGIWSWNWVQTNSNGCANTLDTSATSSVSYTCSGSNVNVGIYTQGNCAGSASTATYAANQACTAQTVTMEGVPAYMGYACTTPAASTAAVCFAGSESIMLESGATVPISDVRVGDKVLAYSSASQSTVFSDVIAVPHSPNNIKANFQHIAMESGADIKMTAEHLLPAGSCSLASLPLARAADVQVGDCVQTTEGVSRVVSNNVVSDEGIYTIVTNADFVVVNGVVASPFAINHAVANFMYGIHRMVYAVAPKMVAPLSGVMSNLAAYFTK